MADVQLLGGVDIRELASRLDVTPTKKLGQNFVTDPNTIRRIVTAAKLTGAETVVEIGPGLGSLTLGLLEVAKKVIAVEIDPKMAAELESTIAKRAPGTDFTLVRNDALKVTELPANPDALVANLPYNTLSQCSCTSSSTSLRCRPGWCWFRPRLPIVWRQLPAQKFTACPA
jgi:16S rRNA (adenine1518-N6/adenine1519-N6)-dimethyltransferase